MRGDDSHEAEFELELEDRTSRGDNEPLLPVDQGAVGDAKVVIGNWALACLLLQHLSRSA